MNQVSQRTVHVRMKRRPMSASGTKQTLTFGGITDIRGARCPFLTREAEEAQADSATGNVA